MAAQPSAPPGFTDHTFKSASGVELAVRVWPAETTVNEPAPFVLWTHGGGWFGGFHFAPLPWMAPGFRQRGYHFVSHNYRLAPQVRVDDQLADCLEVVAWCRTNLPDVLGTDKVDVDRYVLCGESAGGHLATLMGTRLSNPAPSAIVDVYGIVDFLTMPAFGPEDKRPSRAKEGPWVGRFSEEELNTLLRDRNPANVLTDGLSWNQFEFLTEAEISKLWATEFRYTDRVLMQAELHMMHSLGRSADGLHIGILHNEKFANEDEFLAFVRSVSPVRVLQQRVSEGKKGQELYPPTAFLHGTGDVDVPVQQSYVMSALLKDAGVPVVECYEEGGLHVFDMKYTGPEVPGWDTYIDPLLAFVDMHVGRTT
ncbi:alpha/beta-hydrolase [Parathielavia appendiculata]|uniref:Alpha/beta-hydrolase n=1 Tax=Parathielavia appendiculata TaxID=2587402 RepID=A0AAN6Z0Y1_9PEZI|nr:alpha/beta-hydrolase [Parathielavia appendiculata]